jgi:hypothetical protein
LLPFPAVSHGLGERLLLLLVVVAHGPVAGGQVLVAGGAVVIAGLAAWASASARTTPRAASKAPSRDSRSSM